MCITALLLWWLRHWAPWSCPRPLYWWTGGYKTKLIMFLNNNNKLTLWKEFQMSNVIFVLIIILNGMNKPFNIMILSWFSNCINVIIIVIMNMITVIMDKIFLITIIMIHTNITMAMEDYFVQINLSFLTIIMFFLHHYVLIIMILDMIKVMKVWNIIIWWLSIHNLRWSNMLVEIGNNETITKKCHS